QIQAEKAQLIKDKKIKKEKPLPEITADEIPFEIPENWKWVRWGDISQSIQYGYNAPALENGRIKMVRISDIQSNEVLWEDVPYCGIDEDSIETYLLQPNDILFARTGGTVGKSYLVEEVPEEAVYAGYLIRTRYSRLLSPRYLKYFMQGSLYWSQLRNGTIATAQPNCNGKTLGKMIVPLPPLSEQKRIVAKVDEVLAEIKSIDELQYQYASNVDALKSKIIDAGIRGQLTEQLPEDGTAEELYQQIQAEKAQLIKDKKIKKEKPLPEITADEIPFDIPDNWKWVRLGDITINKDSERIPLSVAQRAKLKKNYDYYGASGIIDKVETYIFDVPLLLIGEDGANLLSKSKPVAFIATGKYWVNNHAHVLDMYDGISIIFLMHYINSISLVPYVTGTAQPKINQDNLNKIVVPLPPLSEQKRIVAKIDDVFGALDE
ncbi:MAG: restriction endonuclease subunit S, partial [Anaerovibrio sp.]|uniref:restriction endonuclease subunit S n=1 Tax=Anaerovibrio sp. TaxID=1872532 RepID=UPI001B1B602F